MSENSFLKKDYVMWAGSPADDAMVAEARRVIKEKGWTQDDVKLLRGDQSVTIVAKKDMQ
jgi:hypothetical protein